MSYNIDLRKEAFQDLFDAVVWYDKQQEGLGDELMLAVESAKKTIQRNPYQFEEKYRGIRQLKTTRFPYIIII